MYIYIAFIFSFNEVYSFMYILLSWNNYLFLLCEVIMYENTDIYVLFHIISILLLSLSLYIYIYIYILY